MRTCTCEIILHDYLYLILYYNRYLILYYIISRNSAIKKRNNKMIEAYKSTAE